MDAENTHQVFDWLWSSGQLSQRDIAALPALGIETVINLALPTSTNALRGEAELITAQGITYIQIPVLWEKPEQRQLIQFFSTLETFKDRKLWVHCAKNMRVSAFIYLYRRLRLGEAHDTALHPMREVWEPNETWRAFIDEAMTLRA
jgi:protein tyrosine phosphatase (PTP) superfamily phosphohydrolase (DUF442 family)